MNEQPVVDEGAKHDPHAGKHQPYTALLVSRLQAASRWLAHRRHNDALKLTSGLHKWGLLRHIGCIRSQLSSRVMPTQVPNERTAETATIETCR